MDSIANMLIMLKNASTAGHERVTLPHSKIKDAILACLKKEGFVKDISKKVSKGHAVLEVELAYVEKRPKISATERISKQSRRVYMGVRDLHVVRGGTGIIVLSTPKGIMSGREARKAQVGGEALFRLW